MEEEVTVTQNKSNKTVGMIALVFFLLFVGGVGLALFKGNKSTEMKKETVKEEKIMEEKTEATNAAVKEKDAMTKETKTFAVEGINFSFKPEEIKVKKGDNVKIVFTNMGSFLHDFVIDELSLKTKQIKAGETDEVTFVASTSGIFEYYCSVGKHRQMGMVGKLIVE